jgi:hypothetical protein
MSAEPAVTTPPPVTATGSQTQPLLTYILLPVGVLILFGGIVLGVFIGRAIDRPAQVAEVSSTDDGGRMDPWSMLGDGLKEPVVTVSARSDASGHLQGRVHNQTGQTLESLRLKVKTTTWERVFGVKVRVENNTTQSFKVYVGDPGAVVERCRALPPSMRE